MRILVINEDQKTVDALGTALSAWSVEVVGLTDLWQLIALLDSHHFDWVIGDDVAIMLFKGLSPVTRRCLLTASRAEWTSQQLEVLGVEVIIDTPLERAALLMELKRMLEE
jgi:DNA-binding response OmpR family regulator